MDRQSSADGGPRQQAGSDAGGGCSTYLAVVLGKDGVLTVCAASDEEGLARQLAEYVEWNAHKLWPVDADRALADIARGRIDLAVDRYFARVGERWDPEYLHRAVLATPWRGHEAT